MGKDGKLELWAMGHFTTNFALKLVAFFNFQHRNAVDIQNRLLCG